MHSLLEATFLALPFYVLCALGAVTFVAFTRKTAPRLRRWRYALAAAFVATFLIGAPAFGNALTLRIEQRYPPRTVTVADRHPDNLIVVLTGGWFRWVDGRVDVKISEDGWERLDAGVKLWRTIGGTMLIAGAPARDGSGLSVAAAMAAIEPGAAVSRRGVDMVDIAETDMPSGSDSRSGSADIEPCADASANAVGCAWARPIRTAREFGPLTN